jgi:hypothetical protein
MPSVISNQRRRGSADVTRWVSAMSAMMPPSPLLSARMINTTYLTDTTITSAQKISDSTPSTLAAVTGIPCVPWKASLMVYRGLVPMSPYTTPIAATARPSVRWRDVASV